MLLTAGVCKLFSNFLLHKLSQKYERNNLVLYHDDGLAIFKNVNWPDPEKIEKNFCKLLIDHDLELTIQCNRKVLSFLDVTLNLEYSTLPKRQQQNNLCQDRAQSSTLHNQTAYKINKIKIITVIGKWKKIQEFSHKVFLAGEVPPLAKNLPIPPPGRISPSSLPLPTTKYLFFATTKV